MVHLLKCLPFLHHTDHDHGIKAHGPTGNTKEMIMRHNANLRVHSGDPDEPSSMGLALSWEPVALRSHDLSHRSAAQVAHVMSKTRQGGQSSASEQRLLMGRNSDRAPTPN